MNILHYQPGQLCTIVLEILEDGYRADPSDTPFVHRVIFPNLSTAASFPQDMTRIDTGLYYFRFTLPTLASSVGTYLADVRWLRPSDDNPQELIYQIIVSAPFGQYTVSSS